MPSKKESAEAAREAKPQSKLQSVTREELHDAILERVLQSLDIDGLSASIVDAVATHFAGQVRVEDLIQSLLRQESQELTDKLARQVLARVGKPAQVPRQSPLDSASSGP
jgi:hypothetical protein